MWWLNIHRIKCNSMVGFKNLNLNYSFRWIKMGWKILIKMRCSFRHFIHVVWTRRGQPLDLVLEGKMLSTVVKANNLMTIKTLHFSAIHIWQWSFLWPNKSYILPLLLLHTIVLITLKTRRGGDIHISTYIPSVLLINLCKGMFWRQYEPILTYKHGWEA